MLKDRKHLSIVKILLTFQTVAICLIILFLIFLKTEMKSSKETRDYLVLVNISCPPDWWTLDP